MPSPESDENTENYLDFFSKLRSSNYNNPVRIDSPVM